VEKDLEKEFGRRVSGTAGGTWRKQNKMELDDYKWTVTIMLYVE